MIEVRTDPIDVSDGRSLLRSIIQVNRATVGLDQYVGWGYCVDQKVELSIWDTPGIEDYDRLRPLSYPDSHAILICFGIDAPDSLDNVQEKWIPEVLHFCSGLPIILVGLKKEQRTNSSTIEDLHKTGQVPVTMDQGEDVAKRIGAVAYLECSAFTGEGVTEVFDHVAMVTTQSVAVKTTTKSLRTRLGIRKSQIRE
ncbi:ras-domain-containing protein [Microthyrium microscopicum]|uniref:Ras-domain-containing protein n=1 Tax=Microthyrium microscopicum TaxID=703497 RepID=A0A6A6U8U6_9PEZI|nr:ras-domain-containing protein [Microthyrium microscopicum]